MAADVNSAAATFIQQTLSYGVEEPKSAILISVVTCTSFFSDATMLAFVSALETMDIKQERQVVMFFSPRRFEERSTIARYVQNLS